MIDTDVQKALRAKYNPDGSDLRRAQLVMLDMLKYIDSLCSELNLVYWLDAGTLIGAVRHGGFIPWDDDMDIAMPRRDYLVLKQYLLKESRSDRYALQDMETDPGYAGSWMVLRDVKSEYVQDSVFHNRRRYKGVQVDIFPADYGISPALWKLSKVLEFNRFNDFLNNHSIHLVRTRFRFHLKVLYPLFRVISKSLHRWNDIYRLDYGIPWYYDIRKEVIFPTTSIIFEDYVAKVPGDSVAYLKSIYGEDVLSLQKEEDRQTHNCSFRFFE